MVAAACVERPELLFMRYSDVRYGRQIYCMSDGEHVPCLQHGPGGNDSWE